MTANFLLPARRRATAFAATTPDPARSSARWTTRTHFAVAGVRHATVRVPPLRALDADDTPAGRGRSASIVTRVLTMVDETPPREETTSQTYDFP